jgi:NAD(P)H-quinone oxidoreductase subunit 2
MMMFSADALSAALLNNGFTGFLLQQGVPFLSPEFILLITLLMTIVLSLFPAQHTEDANTAAVTTANDSWNFAMGGSVLALVSVIAHYVLFFMGKFNVSYPVLYGMFKADLLSVVTRGFLLIGFLVVLLMSKRYVATQLPKQAPEFYTILLTAFTGAMFLCGAADLVTVFVSLEMLGICSYLLAGYLRNDAKSTEASLKYLVYGGASSAIFLFGVALLYGLMGGSTSLDTLGYALHGMKTLAPWLPVALVLVMTGIGFKISAAPFHFWTPDVYEGAPTPVTAFLSVISKLAAFVFAIRFLVPFGGQVGSATILVAILGLLSMLVGNTVALKQTNIKRLLAYSTVAHAGYLLLGLTMLNFHPLATVLFYLLTYIFMNLGAFACVQVISTLLNSETTADMAGLVKVKPLLVTCFSIFLLGLAGMPITAGFFAKLFLFQGLVQENLANLGLVLLALIASTVSIYYYLNVIRLMVVAEPSQAVQRLQAGILNNTSGNGGCLLSTGSGATVSTCAGKSMAWAMMISLAGTLLLGILATPIMRVCDVAMFELIQVQQQQLNTFGIKTAEQKQIPSAGVETLAPRSR